MSTLNDSRLRIVLRLFEPGRWTASTDLLGRTSIYANAYAIGNALGRLRSQGLLEDRIVEQQQREWRLTDAGRQELGR